MRRVFLAAVLGWMAMQTDAHAGKRHLGYAYGNDYSDGQVAGNRLYGAPAGGVSPGYSTYGRRLRGGFGRNGFAPTFGPVWGPAAFMPAAGQAPVGGPYSRPSIHPELMLGVDPLVPQDAVDTIAPPAVPQHPAVDAPALN